MKSRIIFAGLILLAVILTSCSRDFSSYKKIQEQKVADYSITLLSSSSEVKKGSGSLLLEFRKSSSGELTKVNNLNVSAVMQMAGNPMSGDVTASETGTNGKYEIKYNFDMVGAYKLNVSFDNGMQAQFLLSVN